MSELESALLQGAEQDIRSSYDLLRSLETSQEIERGLTNLRVPETQIEEDIFQDAVPPPRPQTNLEVTEQDIINHIEDLDLDEDEIEVGLRQRVNQDRARELEEIRIAEQRKAELEAEAKRLLQEKIDRERLAKQLLEKRRVLPGDDPLTQPEGETKQQIDERARRRRVARETREDMERMRKKIREGETKEPETSAQRFNREQEEELKRFKDRLRKATQRGLRRQSLGRTDTPPTTQIGREIQETTQIMRRNIDAVIERGVALEDLRVRGQQLREGSEQFLQEAIRLRKIKEQSPLGAMLKKLLAVMFGLVTGSVAYNTFMAIFFDPKDDEEEEKREEIIEEVESNLGTNSGKMNPEVRRNFGKESLLETSQGDLYYDEEDNILVVSYRGTDFSRLGDRPDLALIDIINDLNMGTESYMGLLVHAGFLRMFLESLPEVKDFINEFMNDDTIIYTTGHSAGSPSAILLAYTINQHRKNHNAVAYVFGSPRFLIEGKSVEMMNSVVPHIFRIDADNDLIPYLPPRIKPNPLPQYMHVGTEYIFKSDFLGGYGIETGDNRTTRSLQELGSILYKIMFLYTGAGDYILADGSSLLGRLIEAKRLLNPATFLEEVKTIGQGILFNLDLIENPYVDRSRYDFRDSPTRMRRVMREQKMKQIDAIKEGFRNSWGDKMRKMNSILFSMTRSIDQIDNEAYLMQPMGADAFVTSRDTLRIKDRFLRAGIPSEAVDNYLKSIFDVMYDRGEGFKQSLIDQFGERIGTAIGNTFGNYLTFRTAMMNLGFATGIALALNFFIQGQYNRFLGHRIVNYDKILSAFTEGKSILKHSIKNESDIIGDHDIKTDEGVFQRTDKTHFGRKVYESEGMNFTPHYHDGEIYMNHLPNLNSAIMGYYLYKPNEFNSGTAIKGFVIY